MCVPLLAVAAVTIASTAVSMAQTAAQQSAARKNAQRAASQANDASYKQSGADYANQEATMRWQDDTWQQDIDFANQTLSYQGREFAKQADYVAEAGQDVIDNTNREMAQTLLKTVQQNIAATLQVAGVNRDAAKTRATAQVQADARGVQGQSVDAIIDDVSRQQGQAVSVMEMNRSAANQQARIDLEAVKAAGDTQLGQLAGSVKVYSPSTPIRAPSPVGGTASPTVVQPAEQSGLGNTLAIVGAGINGAVSGFNAGTTLTGMTSKEAIGGFRSALTIG